jgi:hypothetical protein
MCRIIMFFVEAATFQDGQVVTREACAGRLAAVHVRHEQGWAVCGREVHGQAAH